MAVLVYLTWATLKCYSPSMNMIVKTNLTKDKVHIWKCSVKKPFLKILQNSLKTTCARVSFQESHRSQECSFIKRRFQHRWSCGNFVKLLRVPILQNTCGRPSLLKVNYFTTSRFSLTITRITFEYEKFHVSKIQQK